MSESRRILYHHRIRSDDGQAVHVSELITALRAAGHEVAECALFPKTGLTSAGSGATPATIQEPSAGPVKTSFWQRFSPPRTAVEMLEVLYNYKGRAMLRAAAQQSTPHFLYERHALHLHAGLDIARELNIPLLLEVNSPMVLEMQRLGKLCLGRRARRSEQNLLAKADAILAVTEVLKDILIDAGARRERVHVIGNGAVVERYDNNARTNAIQLRANWSLAKDAFVLGFVGYMRPWHRLDLILDVMQRPGLESLVFVLFGEGPALQDLQQKVAQQSLQERVKVQGVITSEDLPKHVMACDSALIPAINSYASPLKLFDSLAAGIATLVPDQPNLREYIIDGENGLLFASGNPDDLYRQLLRIVSDRELARRIGSAGRTSLIENQWTWHGNAERVVEVYNSLPAMSRQGFTK